MLTEYIQLIQEYVQKRKINKISYEEMLEMAILGAKVLKIRSVEFAKKYNVPVHVRSSFNEEERYSGCE